MLIDPQFAPKVIVKPEAGHMVELIATTAKAEDVDLFRRFDVMRRWRDVDHMAFDTFVSPDGLHMNDWSYACMAKGLGIAIAEAAARPVMSATALSYLMPNALSAPNRFASAQTCIQRRQQILDQVVGMLKPGGKPHQPIADAEFGALLGREPLMRGRRRVRDQALGVAEIVGDADQLAAR